jgi:hypothetical protein
MGVTVELLPLTTIEKALNEEISQNISDTIDTSRYSSGAITARVLKSSGTGAGPELRIEGSDDGQTFEPVSRMIITGAEAPATKKANLNRAVHRGSDEYLWRYFRWVLDPPTTNMEFCGRVTIVLK